MQPGEKVAFDSPLVTVVDLKDMELQALVPAVDVPELAIGMPVELAIDGFGERRFTGRVERINPATEPGTRAILVYVGIPNADRALRGGMFATGRIALAAERPGADAAGDGGPHRSRADVRLDDRRRQARAAHRHRPAAATTPPGASRSRRRCRRMLPVLAARFDNLKDGAPALVKAPRVRRAVPASAPATTPTSGRTQAAA